VLRKSYNNELLVMFAIAVTRLARRAACRGLRNLHMVTSTQDTRTIVIRAGVFLAHGSNQPDGEGTINTPKKRGD
jgi:hypothetical protein